MGPPYRKRRPRGIGMGYDPAVARFCPWLLLPILALPGCPTTDPPAADDGSCSSWVGARLEAPLEGDELTELSGLAASHRYPDVLWAINDQGHAAVVYAVDREGAMRGSFALAGTEVGDWEDLAVGPCGAGSDACSCLYVADTGDNELQRDTALVLRFPEPDLADEGSVDGVATGVEQLWFSYPDSRHDAEALLVDPVRGDVVVVSKAVDADGKTTHFFAFPDAPPSASSEGSPTVLDLLASDDLDDLDTDSHRITAGDVSPRGHRAVLASDRDLLVYDIGDGGLRDTFPGSPLRLAVQASESVEGATFALDGQAVLLSGESEAASLWEAPCASFTSDGDLSPDPLVECGGR